MKPSHILIMTLTALSLTACGSSTPAPIPIVPTAPTVGQPIEKESDKITELKMENALTDLDKVE